MQSSWSGLLTFTGKFRINILNFKVIAKYKESLRIEISSSQFLNPKTLRVLIHKDTHFLCWNCSTSSIEAFQIFFIRHFYTFQKVLNILLAFFKLISDYFLPNYIFHSCSLNKANSRNLLIFGIPLLLEGAFHSYRDVINNLLASPCKHSF